MKPDWKDAPEWASYLAEDKDGTWCWYETEPEIIVKGVWSSSEGEWQIAFNPIFAGNMEKRPS